MAEVVRIRGEHGAEYDIDLERNPGIRARIETGELERIKAKRGKATPEPEPEIVAEPEPEPEPMNESEPDETPED